LGFDIRFGFVKEGSLGFLFMDSDVRSGGLWFTTEYSRIQLNLDSFLVFSFLSVTPYRSISK